MSHYHDSDDLKILREFKTLAPVEFGAFVALDKHVGRDDGLDVHSRNAQRAGATRTEIAEAALITAALRAGAAVTHEALALKLYDHTKGEPR